MRRVAVGMTTVNNVVYSIVVVFYGANEIGVPLLCFYYFYLNEVNGVNTDPLFPYMNNKFFSLSLSNIFKIGRDYLIIVIVNYDVGKVGESQRPLLEIMIE